MNKLLLGLGILGTTLVILTLSILTYHDFFTSPEITEKEVGPYVFVTKRHVGSYYSVNSVMNEVDQSLRQMGLNPTVGVGMYYDDPAKVPADELRSDVGDVVEDLDPETLNKIKETFKVTEFPAQRAVVSTMAIKSPLSYFITPIKAYPALSQHWEQQGYPTEGIDNYATIELYDIPNKSTTYIMPIPTQEKAEQ